MFCAKYDTFPNLSGANIQYIEEYYNFSESYFYLFSNNNESAHCIKSLETRPYRKDNQVVRKSGIGIMLSYSHTAYIQRFKLFV